MASLVGQQLKDAYDSLLKTSDNDALGGTYKEITDGSGNGSNLYLGTGGRVGIGLTPSYNFQVYDSSPIISAFDSGANGTRLLLSAENDAVYIGSTYSSNNIPTIFTQGGTSSGTERMRIHSGGDISFRDGSTNEAFYWDASTARLGLGTTSPANILHIQGASDGGVIRTALFENSATAINSKSEIMLVSGGNTNRGVSIASLNESTSGQPASMIFSTSSAFSTPTERMRIDSSGTVMVGKTATGLTNIGVELFQSGGITATRSGDVVQYLNRTTSDGSILEFRKDNTAVGSIGVGNSNDLYIGNDDTGLVIQDNDIIAPWNPSTNALRDDTIDLGYTDRRFKDLYLGGSVYLGGTTSANALDDYEEGTWTPVFKGATTAGTYSFSLGGGKYTKIGNMVTVWCSMVDITESSAGSGNIRIGGLPFTIADDAVNERLATALRIRQASATRSNSIAGGIKNSTDVSLTYDNNASGSGTSYTIASDFSANMDLGFQFSYFV